MTITVHFKQINENFLQENANSFKVGIESPTIPKHKWENEYVDEGIEELDLSPSEDYTFIGVDPNGNEKGLMLPDMCVFRCFQEKDKAMITYLISNSILYESPDFQGKSHYVNKTEANLHQSFYIKPDAEFKEIRTGWIVNVHELPEELK